MLDVAISDDGSIIAATTQTGVAPDYKVYFFTSDGSLISQFELEQFSPILSMSGDGSIVAVGGPGWDSLYVFRVRLPVGGELVSTPILNTMVLLMLIAIIPAVAIGLGLAQIVGHRHKGT
ncbi:MAG: hypothetical protein HXX80_01710 [Nitrososphaerales archaeon]|nr:hypothetical protein [Nitrososphaerales archaeon]